MKKVLLQGTLKGGLYKLDISKLTGGLKLGSSIYGVNKSQTCQTSSNKTCCANLVSLLYDVANLSISNKQRSTGCIAESSINCKPANLWYSRLGHPSNKILSKLNINKNTNVDFFSSCQYEKSHKLPFSSSELHTSSILDLVYADVWGPSPILSVEG